MSYIHSIEVRFRDIDALGHVNNAVLVSFLEQARFQWWRAYLGDRKFTEEGFLIARIEVDYRQPILLTDLVRVALHCSRVGNSSFDLDYRVYREQDNATLAVAKTIQVMLDFKTQRPAPLREETRRWMETQV
jgi:acyl-CoA thioester hydrolase